MKKTILISSAGRRNQLIDCFRQDALALGLDLRVIAIDAVPALSPACHAADSAFSVPPCTDPEFAQHIVRLCIRESVDVIIPTIDPELPIYAENRARFDEIGTKVVVSSPSTVALARSKMATAQRLTEFSVPVPRTVWWNQLKDQPSLLPWPVILKPNSGSGSQGVVRLRHPDQRDSIAENPEMIAQEWLQGAEYTVNIFVDRSGSLRCTIPHERLEIRAGEVSKGVTRRIPALAAAAAQLAPVLEKAEGPLCFQAVVDGSGSCAIFEINARFGGGYPLAHRAGGAFTRWILEESSTGKCGADDLWKEGVTMLRYDSAIFSDG